MGRRPARSLAADAIIVAAGSSRRMGGRDKQAELLAGRPVLSWALAALAAAGSVERIVVVTGPDRVAALRAEPWLPEKVLDVVAGGARRQDSVAAGFARLEQADAASAGGGARPERIVLVHDGARPCASPGLVDAVATAAALHGAAVPILAVAETLKRVADGRVAETVERDGLAAAQTPQGVRRSLLRAAYDRWPAAGERTFTDEAALLEACTIPVRAIPGEPTNLKVTVPADLQRAESILDDAGRVAVGLGHDAHPFGPGSPLMLGGLAFDGVPRLHGHSDGDVVLHALADALLGAAGLGDLGRLFPADARTPRGIAGRELLIEVMARVAERGRRPASVDVVIVAARPRLAARLGPMAAEIAALLDLDPSAVNVKASTGNLDGLEGTGRGISAQVVVVLRSVASPVPLGGGSAG